MQEPLGQNRNHRIDARTLRMRLPLAAAVAALGSPALSLAQGKANEGVTRSEILLGSTFDMTGPLKDSGAEIKRITEAFWADVNAQGGIHGRKVRIEALDDGYDPKRSVENVRQLLARPVFALCWCIGTANNLAIYPLIRDAGVPSLFPLSGVRPPGQKNVFYFRASYADEVKRLVHQFGTVGVGQLAKLAVVYQNNAFGTSVLESAKAEMAERKLEPVLVTSINSNGDDIAKVATAIVAAQANYVILLAAGLPQIGLVKALQPRKSGIQISVLSLLTPNVIDAMGEDAAGLTVTQIVPFPWSPTLPITRDYHAFLKRVGMAEPSHSTLETYAAGRLLVEGLRRTGRDLTRQRLAATLSRINDFNLGGIPIDWATDPQTASRYVELNYLDRRGRFIR